MITNDKTLGSIDNTSDSVKRKHAAASLEYNIKHTPTFVKLFPEYVERYEYQLSQQKHSVSSTVTTDTLPPNTITTQQPVIMGIYTFLQSHIRPVAATMAGLVAIVSIVVAMRFI